MEQTLSDNHVDFCDIFLLWSRLYPAIMLVSATYFFYGATLSVSHIGFRDIFLLWNILYLTIMLVSVICFLYGADDI
jgi:hypothetical protein